MTSGVVYFLPGEKSFSKKAIAHGILILTNYRLIFSSRHPESTWSIPKTLLWKVEIVGLVHVRIITKIGVSVMWSFEDELASEAGLALIMSIIESVKEKDSVFACEFRSALETNIPKHPFLLSVPELLQIDDIDNALDTALVYFEFRRMSFDESWKVTHVNQEFKVCPTYPRHHIVPQSINDSDILNMASFRSHNRFSSVVWRSQVTGAVLLRCAQPCVGLMYSRNEYDEKFLRAVFASCQRNPGENPSKESPRLLIVDARNYSSAQFNRLRGGGFEYSEYYDQAQISFMDLPNLHTVRVSFERLTQLYSTKPDVNWFSMLEKTSWLTYIGQLLKTSVEIACALELHGRPVMVHCTDGWDRTPQLSSLAQLLADPFYRTIKGFRILIEREWLQFGHKFADRNGQGQLPCNLDERSPIFLQWLDCVHQIYKQFPQCFEFNESLLLKLGLHIYSGLFGTFMYNSEFERCTASVTSKTCSLWGLLSSEHNWTIKNYFYEPPTERLLKPDWQMRSLKLWSALYETALAPNKDGIVNLTPNCLDNNSTSSSVPNSDLPRELVVHNPSKSGKSKLAKQNSSTLFEMDSPPKPPSCSSDLTDFHSNSAVIPEGILNDSRDQTYLFDPNIDQSTKIISSRNSRYRSLGDLVNGTDYFLLNEQQPNDCILPNETPQIFTENSDHILSEKVFPNSKINQGPAILRLSSVSDDTGICSSLVSRPSLSPVFYHNFNCEPSEELTLSSCTYMNKSQQDNLISRDENADVFTPDEQLQPEEFTNSNDLLDDQITNCSFLPSILPLDDEDFNRNDKTEWNHSLQQHNQQQDLPDTASQLDYKTLPIAILSKTADNDRLHVMIKNSHNETQLSFQSEDSPRWSVTTPGSNASLYVLSEAKQSSSVEHVKHIDSSQPLEIKVSESGMISNDVCPPEFIVHSLPENEGLLINEMDSVDYNSSMTKLTQNSEQAFSTPVGEAWNDQQEDSTLHYTVKSSEQNRLQQNNSIVPSSNTGSNRSFNSLSRSTPLFLGDLSEWRAKYFQIEYFSNFISSVSSCNIQDGCIADQFDSHNDRNSGISTNHFDHSLTLGTLSLLESSGVNHEAKNRPVSAPISPTLVTNTTILFSYSNGDYNLNNPSTLFDSVTHLSDGDYSNKLQDGLNTFNWKNKQKSNLIPVLSYFPDWDGLPLLVDRLTIQVHTKACNEQRDRQLQKHIMSSQIAKLKCAQLEVTRLNLLVEKLQQLLENANSIQNEQQLRQFVPKLTIHSNHGSLEQKIDDFDTKVDKPFSRLLVDSNNDFVSTLKVKQVNSDNNLSNQSDNVNHQAYFRPSSDINSFEMVDFKEESFVAWQPDSTARHCTLCHVEFSMIRPKHHCRRCGYIFCGSCSDRRIPIPSQNINKAVRVCRECYANLSRVASYYPSTASPHCPDSTVKSSVNDNSSQPMRSVLPSDCFPHCYPLYTNNLLKMSSVHGRLDSVMENNPLSRCRAGRDRQTSSATPDGIAQA